MSAWGGKQTYNHPTSTWKNHGHGLSFLFLGYGPQDIKNLFQLCNEIFRAYSLVICSLAHAKTKGTLNMCSILIRTNPWILGRVAHTVMKILHTNHLTWLMLGSKKFSLYIHVCTYLVNIYPTYLDLPFFTLPNSYIFEDKPYLEKGNCFEASKYYKVYVKLIL